MKKALIAYFSQTGTTKAIAEAIAHSLASAGWQTDFHRIGTDPPPDLEPYEIVGIGTPTYIYRTPFIVRDFIRQLPRLDGKLVFVLCMYGTCVGSNGNWIRKHLVSKGAVDIGYLRCRGADFFYGFLVRGYLFAPDAPTEDDYTVVAAFGRNLLERYESQGEGAEPPDSLRPFMYALEGVLTHRLISRFLYSRLFFSKRKCDACGDCVAACPMNNVMLKNNGRPQWGTECLLCFNCELKCPQDAIVSVLDWPIMAPFMIYNIQRSKKKNIPYARVEHSGGKTIRLQG